MYLSTLPPQVECDTRSILKLNKFEVRVFILLDTLPNKS